MADHHTDRATGLITVTATITAPAVGGGEDAGGILIATCYSAK